MRTYPQLRLAPAKLIIDALGGPRSVAVALNVNRANVVRWMYPKAAGGTGGLIPQRHHRRIMEVAKRSGVMIGPASFYDDGDAEISEKEVARC